MFISTVHRVSTLLQTPKATSNLSTNLYFFIFSRSNPNSIHGLILCSKQRQYLPWCIPNVHHIQQHTIRIIQHTDSFKYLKHPPYRRMIRWLPFLIRNCFMNLLKIHTKFPFGKSIYQKPQSYDTAISSAAFPLPATHLFYN